MKKIITSLVFAFAIVAQAQTTQTFNYTGSVQTFTVPSCVTSITVDVIGASGGNGPLGCTSNIGGTGGPGGRVQATITVTGGDVLNIYVGGVGANDNNTSANGGFNGGGNAMNEPAYTYYGGGGGGGASDIRLNGNTLNDRIVVAGGGGGAGSDGCNCNQLNGGAGGGLTGNPGQPGAICVCNPSGQGGTPSVGGVKGDWGCSCNATDGTFGIGGNSNSTSCGGPTGGGGGGGGWYGGGGGGLGAGGGGSSYTAVSVTGVTHTQGYQTGNGVIVLTYTVGSGPTVNVTAVNPTVCSGSNPFLSASGAVSYVWQPGNLTGATPTVNPTTTTTYTVTGTDGNGCTGTNTITINVNALPDIITTVMSSPICEGASATLSATGATSYTWMPGNLIGSTQTVSPISTTIYTVTGTDGNGCNNTAVATVTVNPLPAVTYNETQTLVCVNWSPITLTAGTPSNGTYSGTAVTGNTFDPATAGAGTFAIVYTYTDGNNCTNSDTSMITVDLCTGINHTSIETAFSIYPNPTEGKFVIDVNQPNAVVVITNQLGEELLKTRLTAQKTEIDLSSQPQGIYYIQVNTPNGMVTKKVTIK